MKITKINECERQFVKATKIDVQQEVSASGGVSTSLVERIAKLWNAFIELFVPPDNIAHVDVTREEFDMTRYWLKNELKIDLPQTKSRGEFEQAVIAICQTLTIAQASNLLQTVFEPTLYKKLQTLIEKAKNAQAAILGYRTLVQELFPSKDMRTKHFTYREPILGTSANYENATLSQLSRIEKNCRKLLQERGEIFPAAFHELCLISEEKFSKLVNADPLMQMAKKRREIIHDIHPDEAISALPNTPPEQILALNSMLKKIKDDLASIYPPGSDPLSRESSLKKWQAYFDRCIKEIPYFKDSNYWKDLTQRFAQFTQIG